MTNFWEDLKNNITEWSIVASEKAEEFTHTSKLRIDVLQLERKLSSQYVKLGLYVFSKTKEKNVKPTPKSSNKKNKITICLKSLTLEFVNLGLGSQGKILQN